MVIVLMGVTASGKTTVGRRLAERLGWPFHEADDFHPPANVEKMRQGIALDERDRLPWLQRLHEVIRRAVEEGTDAVVACSALKRDYRETLRGGLPSVQFVYLQGERGVLEERLQSRTGHFMSPTLLDSQFETLEEPRDAVYVDADLPPEAIVDRVRRELRL